MAAGSSHFDPAGLAKLANLPLIARQIVEGFLSGCHQSPFHGFSVEFLDHRPYAAGDELRSVDWKVAARTDKYFVKRFQQETNLRAVIALDRSKSMGFASDGISKLRYAGLLTAALTYLLLRQNDAVGLAIFDSELRDFLPPRTQSRQLHRVLGRLDRLELAPAEARTGIGVALQEIAERSRRRGLTILISDLLDDVDRMVEGLRRLRHARHEVLVFHVLDPAEMTLAFDRTTEFRASEGEGRLAAHPDAVRTEYLVRLNRFIDAIRGECRKQRISYETLVTSEPYDRALASFLDRRRRLG